MPKIKEKTKAIYFWLFMLTLFITGLSLIFILTVDQYNKINELKLKNTNKDQTIELLEKTLNDCQNKP
jgi:hypothetical protein